MEIILIVGMILLGLAVIAALIWRSSDDENLEKWARENDFKILEKQPREGDESPFSYFSRPKGVEYFRITIEDKSNKKRRGWIQASGNLAPFFTPAVRVVWDDESAPKS